MGRSLTAEEVRREHLETLGPDLGPVYHSLYNDFAWLHIKWQQFVELFGTSSERVELLNHAAALFFRIIQDILWEDTLLHLTRLTDPPISMGRGNLTIQQLPTLITNRKLRDEVQALVNAAVVATRFARDWRNRHIAHRDVQLALNAGSNPLAPASRKHVKDALFAIARVFQSINEFYFKSEILFDALSEPKGAISVLQVIQDGLEAEKRRQKRFQQGEMMPEAVRPPRTI